MKKSLGKTPRQIPSGDVSIGEGIKHLNFHNLGQMIDRNNLDLDLDRKEG